MARDSRTMELHRLDGVLPGAFIAFGELTGGGGPHRLRRLFVVSAVYIGLEDAGVLIGYALSAKPLGSSAIRL